MSNFGHFVCLFQKDHKLKVFAGARVCFVGFPEDETQHMAEVLASNGGGTCPLDDPDCTHVVSYNITLHGNSQSNVPLTE